MAEKYFFEEIKEKRKQYYVVYKPRYSGGYASVHLTFIGNLPYEKIISYMEYELDYWLRKYQIPVWVYAFDIEESLIHVKDDTSDGLYGWFDPTTKTLKTTWEHNIVPDFTLEEYGREQWLSYIDIPYKTAEQVKENAYKNAVEQAKGIRLFKFIWLMWVCIIPIAWAIIKLLGPFWLGVLVTMYSLRKAWDAGKKIYGKSKKSDKDLQNEELKRKMDHYFYHCELNPDGFNRLKLENFQKESREQTLNEFNNIVSACNTNNER